MSKNKKVIKSQLVKTEKINPISKAIKDIWKIAVILITIIFVILLINDVNSMSMSKVLVISVGLALCLLELHKGLISKTLLSFIR